MRAADYIVDIGPGAGVHGGEVVAAGHAGGDHGRAASSITGQYLSGEPEASPFPPSGGRATATALVIRGRSGEQPRQDIDVTFPLGTFTCVTGVSGSRASPPWSTRSCTSAWRTDLNRMKVRPGKHKGIEGDGVSGQGHRHRPVPHRPHAPAPTPPPTPGLFDDIRELFASTPDAKARGYRAGPVLLQREGRPLRGLRGRRLI